MSRFGSADCDTICIIYLYNLYTISWSEPFSEERPLVVGNKTYTYNISILTIRMIWIIYSLFRLRPNLMCLVSHWLYRNVCLKINYLFIPLKLSIPGCQIKTNIQIKQNKQNISANPLNFPEDSTLEFDLLLFYNFLSL